ncbi:MAG TPA: glutamate--tRNA ligase [Gammaproteobacteria bacterium]|nr:glutamate--tRNA ligase [Gammaproteobacteria bacterium]
MKKSEKMKTRFSPSPTGQMHLGNVRTALFSYLLTHHHHGEFLLRIEDTDQMRSKDEFTELLFEDLKWLGLNWDEGPYYQSKRQDVYHEYYEKLLSQKQVYECFCTDEQLALSRKIQLSQSKPPRYAGTCQKLSVEEVAEKKSHGLKPTLRFRVPLGKEINFNDLVKGYQRFRTDDIGDFIIRRSDGSAAFFFCNAIDDSVMGVTHALRGEDHLTNTPRQILILQTLGLPVPEYGHISLIIGNDGSKLSKRHGSKDLKTLREEGFLPVALNNYLGRLGHSYEEIHLMDLPKLAKHFSVKHIGTTPAQFDMTHLLHWQKHGVMGLSDEDFWNWLGKDIQTLIPENKKTDFINFMKPNIMFPHEAREWADILFGNMAFSDDLKNISPEFINTAIESIDSHGSDYPSVTKMIQDKLTIKGKALFQPLRIILTGQLHGPELHNIFNLLGKDGLLKRLEQAKKHAANL